MKQKLLVAFVVVAALLGLGAVTIYPQVGLLWVDTIDPTLTTGVSAPQGSFLVRTDTSTLYWKSGAANTAWTQLSPSPSGGKIDDRISYTATGSEGASFTVTLPVTASVATYSVFYGVRDVTAWPFISFPDAGRTTSQFSVAINGSLLTAGDKLTFYVVGANP